MHNHTCEWNKQTNKKKHNTNFGFIILKFMSFFFFFGYKNHLIYITVMRCADNKIRLRWIWVRRIVLIADSCVARLSCVTLCKIHNMKCETIHYSREKDVIRSDDVPCSSFSFWHFIFFFFFSVRILIKFPILVRPSTASKANFDLFHFALHADPELLVFSSESILWPCNGCIMAASI